MEDNNELNETYFEPEGEQLSVNMTTNTNQELDTRQQNIRASTPSTSENINNMLINQPSVELCNALVKVGEMVNVLQQNMQSQNEISRNSHNIPLPRLELSQIFDKVELLNLQNYESVVNFIASVDDVIKYSLFEESVVLRYLITKVHSISRENWSSLVDSHRLWSSIRLELMKYIPFPMRQVLVDKFVRRDQRLSESFNEFVLSIERFSNILTPAEDYTTTASVIMAHVNYSTYNIVKHSACPISPEEMRELVLKVENIRFREKSFQSKDSPNLSSPSSSSGFVSPPRTFNPRFNNSTANSNATYNRSSTPCAYCKKPGHHIKKCFKLNRQNQSSSSFQHSVNVIPHPEPTIPISTSTPNQDSHVFSRSEQNPFISSPKN